MRHHFGDHDHGDAAHVPAAQISIDHSLGLLNYRGESRPAYPTRPATTHEMWLFPCFRGS
jgi:hypothetical protein